MENQKHYFLYFFKAFFVFVSFRLCVCSVDIDNNCLCGCLCANVSKSLFIGEAHNFFCFFLTGDNACENNNLINRKLIMRLIKSNAVDE